MQSIKTNSREKSINFFFPIALILGIVPLIVRLTFIQPDSNLAKLYGTSKMSDLFSQRKALFLIIFAIVLIGICIVFFKKIFSKKDKIVNYILIAAGIFLLFTAISAILSPYKQQAFYGMYDRAEGLITIACYMVIFIYSIYTFKTTDNYKYIVIPILIVVAINSFLGFFQYIGQDLIKSDLGKLIAVPSEYTNISLTLSYEAGKLYGTLFHYNYVGSFVAIVLPILFCIAVFEKYEIGYKIFAGIGSLLCIWLLLGSTSRAGIIGLVMSIIFSMIIFGKLISKRRKQFLIGLGCIVIVAIIGNFATKGAIFARIPSLISDSFSVFKDTSDFDYREHSAVKDVKNTDKGAEITLPNDTLKIGFENGNYVFKNSKDEVIQFVRTNNKDKSFKTNEQNFSNVSLEFAKLTKTSNRADGVIVNIDNKPGFMFRLKSDNTIHLVDYNSGADIDIVYPDTFGFKGKEKLGSMRGYIWARALPLLKQNILIGSGPDTFVFKFPQNDLVGKYYAYDTANMVVDKPHNLYLQIALNEGLIALLAFLAVMIIYIIDSLKLYALKNEYENDEILGAATCLGVIGYLFAGLFNDSVISVAPIFWIVLGVGVTINFINRQKLKKNF